MDPPPTDDGRQLGLFHLPIPRGDLELGLHHRLPCPDGRRAVPEAQSRRVVGAALPAFEIDPGVAEQTARHVRPVPPGVHAHRSPDRARHPYGPREPGPPGIGRLARHHGKRRGGTGAQHEGRGARRVGGRERHPVEPVAEADHHPVEPGVGHQKVRASAQDAHRQLAPGQRGAEGSQVVGSVHLHHERGRSPHTVGGEGTEGMVPERPRSERIGQCLQAGTRRGRHHHRGDSSNSSGRAVRSPAPRVRHRSPGRSMDETTRRRSSQLGA